MPKFLKLGFACGLLLFPSTGTPLPPPVPVLIQQENGALPGDYMGYSVAPVGDVNGDGKPDFIVGAVHASPGGVNHAGSAYVYAGSSGALLYQKDGASNGEELGYSVAGAGDVNGDGKPDFIVGAPFADPNAGIPDAGSAYVYSGSNGALLYQKDGATTGGYLGYSVGGAGDVNGDGVTDFIIGAYGAGSGGSAYVYSGASGVLLYQKDGAAELGYSVAGAGDVNGDGKADFIIGEPNASPGGLIAAGSAYVYSGATGALLYQKDGGASDDGLGRSVAGAGDMNGDGKSDFIVGAFAADPGGFTDAGSVYVYSGATGGLLYQKDGAASLDFFGQSLAGVGDVNCDGKADFIIGDPAASPGGKTFAGSAFVYSGATGALFYQKDGAAIGDNLGFSVSGAGGDINGDGGDDFIIGAPGADPGGLMGAGTAFVYSLYGPCTFPSKGDMDGNGNLSPADVVLMLNCVYLTSGNCDLSFADVDCSSNLSPADVVLELNAVFLSATFPC